jgi:hypothetical protein
MSSFTDIELAYLGDRSLGRVASVGKDGTPTSPPSEAPVIQAPISRCVRPQGP